MYMFGWTNIVIVWTSSLYLADSRCPVGSYILSDNSFCYWVTSGFQTAVDSIRVCQMNNGELAIIPNQRINDEIKTVFFNEQEELWAGVNDKEIEGIFKNFDGSQICWTNWAEGQPNDINIPSRPSQDCVFITSDGKWYDDDCSRSKRALCFRKLNEFPSTQTTSVSTPQTEAPAPVTTQRPDGTISESVDVTNCKKDTETAELSSTNMAKLIIKSGGVGFLIGMVVTTVIILFLIQRYYGSPKRQSQNSSYEPLHISANGSNYDGIDTTNPVTRGTPTYIEVVQ